MSSPDYLIVYQNRRGRGLSKEALIKLIEDASGDASLWARIMEWPQEIMTRYSISEDELDALRSSDLGQLRELGVDESHLEQARDLAA